MEGHDYDNIKKYVSIMAKVLFEEYKDTGFHFWIDGKYFYFKRVQRILNILMF